MHLITIRFAEPDPERATGEAQPFVDVRGALEAIRAVPGLLALILLAGFNNLLAGVFKALMDGYGLSLVSVEAWGLLGASSAWRSSPVVSSSPAADSGAARCASSSRPTS